MNGLRCASKPNEWTNVRAHSMHVISFTPLFIFTPQFDQINIFGTAYTRFEWPTTIRIGHHSHVTNQRIGIASQFHHRKCRTLPTSHYVYIKNILIFHIFSVFLLFYLDPFFSFLISLSLPHVCVCLFLHNNS